MAFNDPITDEQIDTFIDVLTKSGNVSFACRLAGISHSHSYYMKKNKAGFSDRWEEALKVAADSLEEEAPSMGWISRSSTRVPVSVP